MTGTTGTPSTISVDLGAITSARSGLSTIIDQLTKALKAFGGSEQVPRAAFGKLGSDFAAAAAQVHDEVQAVVNQLTQAQRQYGDALGTTGASMSNVSQDGARRYNGIQRGVDDIDTRNNLPPAG